MITRIFSIKLNAWLVSLSICFLFLHSCEDFYPLEIEGLEPILVIDGSITDNEGPYTINLAFSTGVYSGDQIPVEEAIVEIVEENGVQEILSENEPGQYTTSLGGMQGTPGKSYKINIRLKDGRVYESEYQKMPPSIAIESVGSTLEYRYLSIAEPEVPGFQFEITSEEAENSENYMLWAMEATFKYESDFTIDYVYDRRRVSAYPNPSEFRTCWRTDQVNEVFTFNTATLSKPKIERMPLHFEIATQRELSIRYSLLVKQFNISQEAYIFWNKLKGQIENQESLYSSQPFQFRGNVYNVENPDELVLGFFMVAGLDEERIFVDHPAELDLSYSYCTPDFMSYGFVGLLPRSSWPVYIYEDESGQRALAEKECFDCRELDGSLTPPDFWVE